MNIAICFFHGDLGVYTVGQRSVTQQGSGKTLVARSGDTRTAYRDGNSLFHPPLGALAGSLVVQMSRGVVKGLTWSVLRRLGLSDPFRSSSPQSQNLLEVYLAHAEVGPLQGVSRITIIFVGKYKGLMDLYEECVWENSI